MEKLLINNATIVNYNGQQKADILLEKGKIKKIQRSITRVDDCVTLDASDKYVFPGGIDPHVHFNLKTPAGYTADNFESGSKAALAGGTTTIIDFVTPEKQQSLEEALLWRKKEAENCSCNYYFHVSPIAWSSNTANEMQNCMADKRVTSFKVYMAYTESIGLQFHELREVFKTAAQMNAVVLIHAEADEKIKTLQEFYIRQGKVEPEFHALSRPAEVEVEAVQQAIALAKETSANIYFVHISAKASLDAIKAAREKGYKIFAETCPQYLLFDDSKLKGDFESSAPFVFSPALHEWYNKEGLWQGIQQGSIQTIGTDHCPFNTEQKRRGIHDFTQIPNGVGGVEYRMLLLYHYGVKQGKITWEQFVQLCSYNASKIFDLKTKGRIEVGYDADLIVFSETDTYQLNQKNQYQHCDINIYHGLEISGKIEQVILKGNLLSI